MIRAEDIADPGTMAVLLTGGTFLIALAVHGILRARYMVLVSAIIVVMIDVVLYLTIYRDAFSQDAMAGIGLIIGAALKFTASMAAAVVVLRFMNRRRP